MTNYKETLNLPKTKFSMKANLPKKELSILKKWNENKIYFLINQNKAHKKNFFLNDGPPYANGNIHIGHAVNKILKDIIIKYKSLSGYNIYYTPSWDCHGLPIEHQIEKKNKYVNQEFTKKNFRDECRKYALKQVNLQKSDFIRLGIFGDWENSYLTMNQKNEANIVKSLIKMVELGYIYKDFKPVHWCINCQSSLAEAEVEYQKKSSISIIIKLKLINKNIILKSFNINSLNKEIYLTIWTTTPWTIPACKAIAIHPNLQYQLIDIENCILIISQNLVHNTIKKIGIKQWKILYTISGEKLLNTKFLHPFLNIHIPTILGEHVTQNLGTGAVHTAPEFGHDDYYVCKKNNINFEKTIDGKGNFKKHIHPKLNGINIFNSIPIILELLKNNNSLLNNEKFIHNYPYCWRHKTPIISRATQQLFININHKNLRQRCIEYIQTVAWIPKWSKKKMIDMITCRPDWCISRQRIWGVPIPLFIHKKTGKFHPNTSKFSKKIIQNIENHGIQSWFDIDKKSLLGKNHSEYKKIEDVIDVWFESGSIKISNIYNKIKQKNDISDICIEGLDQHRGWFMSSLIISTATNNQTPYKTVITHGFVVDEYRKKMSKSIGNTINPTDIVNTLGADILRLWTASTNYSKEMSISKNTLAHISDYYRRIRNTARFLLANLHEFNPKKNCIPSHKMIKIDKWAISQTLYIQKKIISCYKKYEFHEIVKYIMNFCSINMGSFYLEIIKDRQYTTKSNSISRRSCQTAMYLILNAFIKWIAPILSFTADEIWSHLPKNKNDSVFLEKWSNDLFHISNLETMNDDYWNQLLTIKNEVNKALEEARKNKILGNSLDASIVLYVDNQTEYNLKLLENELKFLFIVSEVKIKKFKKSVHHTLSNNILKNFNIHIKKMHGNKCPRCWHIISTLKTAQNSELCTRCILNTIGPGEIRKFL